jgi:hypothetical protein
MTHLFPTFLTNESDYQRAEDFWTLEIWGKVSEISRTIGGWRPNWFQPQPPRDGNPIFTAISDVQRKAIRVIQYEPGADSLEFDFWLDTFGGSPTDPRAIRELVIACSLSTESAQKARELIASWVSGEIELANTTELPQGSTTIIARRPRWQFAGSVIDFNEPDLSSLTYEEF